MRPRALRGRFAAPGSHTWGLAGAHGGLRGSRGLVALSSLHRPWTASSCEVWGGGLALGGELTATGHSPGSEQQLRDRQEGRISGNPRRGLEAEPASAPAPLC